MTAGVMRKTGLATWAGAVLLMGGGQALCAVKPATSPAVTPEARTSAYFDAIVHDRAQLRLFLQAMPKGGDLHNHLWGAPYAEDFLAWAGEDGLCVTTLRPTIAPAPCDGPGKVPAKGLAQRDPALYAQAIDALSMRNYTPGAVGAEASGHDQFFSTFGRFGAAAVDNIGPMLAVTRELAAIDHVSYVESQANPNVLHDFGAQAQATAWNGDFAGTLVALAPKMPEAIATARREMDAAEAEAARRLDCANAAAKEGPCQVEVRYQAFVERAQPPSFVFAQMALAFALVEADPRFVGVNIVNPEDHPTSLADYSLHMRMFQFLAARHPTVHRALHAGELAVGLTPPRDLTFHIREAVEIAGAQRIGHGVDIAHETGASALLARMARDRVAVEINLTSNDGILGVKGADHPLALYRRAGVPVVLSTDDEGVSRGDMTQEYMRAATEQGLRYVDLKAMARDSLEYAFLPGASLRTSACDPAMTAPGADCAKLLAGSPKASAQWRLERAFMAFERAPHLP
jgi:adenosine deaminase